MLGDREKRAARRLQRQTPLDGVEQEQRRPRLLEENHLIAKREAGEARQILRPLDRHEQQTCTRLVHRLLRVSIQRWINEVGHHHAFSILAIFVLLIVRRHLNFDGIICEWRSGRYRLT